MFCSDMQLNLLRPTPFCDLLSLMMVAYDFIEKEVPYTKFSEKLMKIDDSKNLFDPPNFRKMRLRFSEKF